ncbi:MAG: DUF5372 family protein [Serratia sp. (in: enterobacteria)]|uniref:DUF5372 family protein n=1 Tax=Serratia sp. (in: enterobacteria) TaxID=616 RepID=UPI003F2E39DB
MTEDEQLVLVTHPFHPLFLRRLPCVGRRYNRYGERLLLQTDNSIIWSLTPDWTALVAPHPEIMMGQGEALLLFDDLLTLSELVEQLSSGGNGSLSRRSCKDNYAAKVKEIMPQRNYHE